MKHRYQRITALLLSVSLIFSLLSASASANADAADDSDEARWEQYWAQYGQAHPGQPEAPRIPRRGTSTSLRAMRARAEALVSFVWTPTTDIYTWNGSSYHGLNYFPAGQSVTGVPYTLFTSEIVDWGLCSLEQYKEVAEINYSVTAYCASVGATRTGPVYGSCCADLVSEVLGGSFLYGRSPRYHNVGGVKRSPYATTLTGQKMADIRAGDALSDVGENHIIWIGYVTDTTLTVYEQTPPVARKLVLDKAAYTNSAGYFIYNGKEYSIITRSSELIDGPPGYAVLTTDRYSYAPDDTVCFRMNTGGTTNTLRIFCPDGTTMECEDAGEICRLSFRMSGHFQALVEAKNEEGALLSSRIDFVVGPPTRSVLTADRHACAANEPLTFRIDADGDRHILWIYCPDGTCRNYQDVGTSQTLRLQKAGHYQAALETRNGEGALYSDQIVFTVGPPTYASLRADKSVCRADEPVTFTADSDGDTNTLRILCPDGTEQTHTGTSNTLQFSQCGEYMARAEASNAMGSVLSDAIRFTVECAHSETEEVIEPTCTGQGYTVHRCSACALQYTDAYTEPLGHSYSYAVTATPTFSSSGALCGTCARCGDTVCVTLPRLNENNYAVSVTKNASCSEPGSASCTWNTTDYGTFCFDAVLATTAHSYQDAVIAPTCTEQGYTLHTCICGDSHRDSETPALGHAWIEGDVTEAPTQTESGVRADSCARCSDTRTVLLPPLGHVHSHTAQTVEPTCTESGYTLHVCSCGDSYRDGEIPAAGHSFGEWAELRAASCTQDGSEQRVCARCGASEERSLPALGHDYAANVAAPACTAPGRTVHTCTRCGDSYEDAPVEAPGHSYRFSVTQAPTPAFPGTLTGVCSLCANTVHRALPPLNDGDYVRELTQAASCAGAGSERYTCAAPECGELRFERSIPAEPHSYTAKVTAPSCSGCGYTTFSCTVCGETHRGAYTPALEHSWNGGTVMTAPTQTSAGVKMFICDACGAMITEEIPLLVHTHSYSESVIPPTCTEPGHTLCQCSCGVTYIDNETPALGHEWDAGVVTVEPTRAAEGTKLFTCTRCGSTRSEALPRIWDPDIPCDGSGVCPGRVFDDMPAAGSWAHDAIDWAILNRITTGTGASAFSPDAACTRAQVVTFLWRTAGCPAPENEDNPFLDVKQDSFCHTAVLWAVEQEITMGTGDTTFSPDDACTRGQIVTFLWRFRGSPTAEASDTSFTDLKPGAFYCDAVAWAAALGVTNGTGRSSFSPEARCTRAQVVTFLCRAVHK